MGRITTKFFNIKFLEFGKFLLRCYKITTTQRTFTYKFLSLGSLRPFCHIVNFLKFYVCERLRKRKFQICVRLCKCKFLICERLRKRKFQICERLRKCKFLICERLRKCKFFFCICERLSKSKIYVCERLRKCVIFAKDFANHRPYIGDQFANVEGISNIPSFAKLA